MADMMLDPFSASLRFSFPEPVGISKLTQISGRFMETLAALCQSSGPCLIGHIKGLALLKDRFYVRVSVVSASLPAQIETNASGEFPEMTVTLNMLVYGLSRQDLGKIAEEAAALVGAAWSATVTIEPAATMTRGD
jgi:hypothetical protein